jgi:hypothetical protein
MKNAALTLPEVIDVCAKLGHHTAVVLNKKAYLFD